MPPKKVSVSAAACRYAARDPSVARLIPDIAAKGLYDEVNSFDFLASCSAFTASTVIVRAIIFESSKVQKLYLHICFKF